MRTLQMRLIFLLTLSLLIAVTNLACTRGSRPTAEALTLSDPGPSYESGEDAWRNEHTEYIRRQFVSIVGQSPLKEGTNIIGSGREADLYVNDTAFPSNAGEFHLEGGKITFVAKSKVPAQLSGKEIRTAEIQSDAEGKRKPDALSIAGCEVTVLEREGKFHVRVRNRTGEQSRSFNGLEFFPIERRWRIPARYTPHSSPREVGFETSGNDFQTRMMSLGTVTFTIDGQSLTLEAIQSSPGSNKLQLLFRDASNGKETYPGGRYLYFDMPSDGQPAVLDFNRATSPPCAVTPFGFCPLAPRSARVNTPVLAGEKYAKH